MAAIMSLLIALTLSLLVTRIAAMALMLTGMSREAARFQARSAFTGVGFTTQEAEEGAYLGTPTADMEIRAGDILVLYGPILRIEELDQRRKGQHGQAAHEEAVEELEEVLEEQEEIDDKIEEQREHVKGDD